jgi:hypothetical protein
MSPRSPHELIPLIQSKLDECEADAKSSYEAMLEVGQMLLEAKADPEIGGYGKWIKWCSNFRIGKRKLSYRQLKRYMDLAGGKRPKFDIMSNLTLDGAELASAAQGSGGKPDADETDRWGKKSKKRRAALNQAWANATLEERYRWVRIIARYSVSSCRQTRPTPTPSTIPMMR